MKLLARTCAALSSAGLLIGIVLGLSGCQGTIPIPTTVAASPLPPLNLTDTRTSSPTLIALPTLTRTPLPAPTNLTVANLSPQTTPAPWETRSDGAIDRRTLQVPPPSNSNAPTLAAVPSQIAQPSAEKPTSLPFSENDLFIHVPPQAKPGQPLRVLLVLHGMGGRGDSFAESLIGDADRYNWVVVAPTMPYRDHMNLTLLIEDDLKISRMLDHLLDSLPIRLGLRMHQHILVYGFSRGAQLAERFSLIHPERIESLVTMSGGTYTLPSTQKKDHTLLPFPFGIGDFETVTGHPLDWESYKRISFWVAVGERDIQPSDVPRDFDPYLGQTRVDRANAFAKALSALGLDSHLVLFPNTGHEVTPEMRQSAVQFLRNDEVADHWDD